jgi:photosystem II stability/assembly factor-like uncharacterized protein
VFSTKDFGKTWSDLTALGMRYWTKDLTIDPNDSAQNTWYVAVSGADTGNSSGLGGVYRTTDRGKNWVRIYTAPRVESIALNPKKSGEAFISTDGNGVIYTTNIGAVAPAFNKVASYTYDHPVRVYFNPYNAGQVWVTAFGFGVRVGNR